jgi:hypothetical protein
MATQGLATIVLGLIVTALFSGCGAGFSAQSGLATPSSEQARGGDQNGRDGSGDNTAPGQIDAGQYETKVSGGSFDGLKVVSIDWKSRMITFRLPMLASPIFDGASLEVPLPQIPGAFVGIETLQNGSALVVRMPLDRFLKGLKDADPSRLPNGDPLPGVPDGELPSLALDVSQLVGRSSNIKSTLYLAPTVIGVFVSTPFDPFIRLTFPLRNESKRVMGYFSTVPKKTTFDGGFFLSFALPDDLARELTGLL